MSEIFLYTADAEIPSAQLEALRRKGFIPVKVKSLDAVKMLPMPVPIRQASLDLMLEAAMATFTQFSTTSAVAGTFGMELAKRYLAATPAQTASGVEL